ncbi:MAG: prolyl oligopeptidase family serine peptidase [Candidatus Cloacimonetes bacterium]|nr:prolyl oligopeptidase family serine peptidase [Candidatus Cloacimonadota bacterium]MCK9184320.1 prolyl oligopeptidase family serine peptidase [Candidatus Cloacimonadota bacterium]
MKYPIAPKGTVTDDYFGSPVPDPYRWLEDDHSPETQAWVKKQQALTETILNQYPARKAMLARLKELNDYPKQSCPIKRGDWYYYAKNDGLQNQWVSYRKRSPEAEEELFFDPNTLSPDGTTVAYQVGISKDFKYFCYQVSQAGADAGEFWVMDTQSKTFLEDKLLNMRHSGASWYKDGYFYSRYDDEQDYQQQDQNQRVYYHKLGDKQEQDKLIYEDPANPLRFYGAYVSDDQSTLFIIISQGTSGDKIIYRPIDDAQAPFQVLFEGFDFDAYPLDAYEEGYVYLFTNKNAKNFRLVKVDLADPAEANWVEIIPERDYLLENVTVIGGKLIAVFVRDVQSRIEVLDTEGKFLYPIEMPYQGTAAFRCGRKEDTEGYFYFSSYIRPDESYHYDLEKNQLSFYHRDPIKAEVENLVSEQVFFTSKDGSQVPMTLTYQKGMQKTGNNPVFMYGYGGFGYALTPSFSSIWIALLEKGFIYVVVNLRGGLEYGESWHEQGMLHNKQNVFDDFIASAEHLISEGYTCPDKIAIHGGSNGGLLVGACLTQRPDLFKVAIPYVGVFDMLRYHKFTCGWGWIPEYGNPEEEEHFHNLLAYSPLHNVKAGVKYPATMVSTADHDDRVIPGHSFKFAATLQEHAEQELPLLLYTQFEASHGTSNMSKAMELWADIFSFTCLYLGV